MKLTQTAIADVVLIEPTVFEDERGWFMESFNERRFNEELKKLGLPTRPLSFRATIPARKRTYCAVCTTTGRPMPKENWSASPKAQLSTWQWISARAQGPSGSGLELN